MERFIYALATGCVAAIAGFFIGLAVDQIIVEIHKQRRRRNRRKP